MPLPSAVAVPMMPGPAWLTTTLLAASAVPLNTMGMPLPLAITGAPGAVVSTVTTKAAEALPAPAEFDATAVKV